MKKLLLLATLCGGLLALPGCRLDADVRPANYDALALATGHWEWESSHYGFRPVTPASVGFTRQLVFGAFGQLTVRRSGQADYHTPYQLSMRTTPANPQAAPVPVLSFTSESDLPNSYDKTYGLTSSQNGQPVLTLAGEAAPVDGDAVEKYYWVAE